MKNTKYFKNPETFEELKKQYRELAMKHHPDKGGNTATMQEVKNEYDELFEILKNIHRSKSGFTYTEKTATHETAEQFKNIIDELMRMEDVIIEIIGCFIWVTGNTKIYKDKLKELKFLWHSKKIAWYAKPENYKKKSHKDYDLETIRDMYGTSGEVKSKGTTKLNETTA